MEPTVSIIVPVYNAEDYIGRCIESIIHQEYEDFELLLVDDGSTDSSGDICDRYGKQDSRIRIIHKKNTGVSDTRNSAIAQARGTFLQFLDSDDWMTPDATKLFVRAADTWQCDLVIADFYRVAGERLTQKGDIDEERVLTREEYAAYMMENPADFYYGVLWNKLYRRDIIEKYHLRMDETISWCEDFMFNLEYILHAKTFYALQTPVYYYVKRKGSLVNQNFNISQTVQMKLSVFEYYNNFYKNVYEEKDYEKKRLQVYRFLVDAANDNIVPPAIMPNVKKLGNERAGIHLSAASGEGILSEQYRNRKLLEHYVETAAIKNDLSLKEVKLLFHLTQSGSTMGRKDLADFMGISVSSLAFTIQKLSLKGFIKITEQKGDNSGEKAVCIELLPSAEPVLDDLAEAVQDYDQLCFAGFTPEETEQFHQLMEKRNLNLLKGLKLFYPEGK